MRNSLQQSNLANFEGAGPSKSNVRRNNWIPEVRQQSCCSALCGGCPGAAAASLSVLGAEMKPCSSSYERKEPPTSTLSTFLERAWVPDASSAPLILPRSYQESARARSKFPWCGEQQEYNCSPVQTPHRTSVWPTVCGTTWIWLKCHKLCIW